ncbi:hypothetical protein [Borreliella bavariensis]|uniref:hypothetical protein n=1 Tax=Borreliella bavariensis TaxID=664662 RepID=UPI001F2DFB18|nr:hypothetical protein [Borreliella bavariensis]
MKGVKEDDMKIYKNLKKDRIIKKIENYKKHLQDQMAENIKNQVNNQNDYKSKANPSDYVPHNFFNNKIEYIPQKDIRMTVIVIDIISLLKLKKGLKKEYIISIYCQNIYLLYGRKKLLIKRKQIHKKNKI